MSWFTGIVDYFSGVDLNAEQQRSNDLDAQIEAANRRAVDEGTWTKDQYKRAESNLAVGNSETGTGHAVGSTVLEALRGSTEIAYDPAQWWKDTKSGAETVVDKASDLVPDTSNWLWDQLKKVLTKVPFWVWVLVGVGLFLYLGGGAWIRKRVANA